MLCNYSVGVWNRGPSTKVNGITIPGVLALGESIDVDVQPYTTALLLLAYGYNIEVSNRVFVDYFDANIKIGTILKYVDGYGTTLNLEVKTIPWNQDYMEVICLAVTI
jgi:hypothetical protein